MQRCGAALVEPERFRSPRRSDQSVHKGVRVSGFDRILVWGGGAIGGTFAASIAAAGHDVTLVDVNRD
ncbi:MAG: 2-dehydropantoate 2-reductase N-terminal domain-containing protein, partial [Rhizobiaceae bacterium]